MTQQHFVNLNQKCGKSSFIQDDYNIIQIIYAVIKSVIIILQMCLYLIIQFIRRSGAPIYNYFNNIFIALDILLIPQILHSVLIVASLEQLSDYLRKKLSAQNRIQVVHRFFLYPVSLLPYY
jgi:hypothetical protein